MLVTKSYHDIWDCFFLIVAHGYRRKIWLGVGPFRFIDVINSDRPVTDGSSREDSRICPAMIFFIFVKFAIDE